MFFEEFYRKFNKKNFFDYYNLIQNYQKYFKDIKVRIYHKKYLPKTYSIIEDFFHILNVKIEGKNFNIKHYNRGYSPEALYIAKNINPYLYTPEEKSCLRNILQAISTKDVFEKYGYFGIELRKKYLNQYSISNQKIANQFFNRDKVFPMDDLSKITMIKNNFNKDELNDIVTQLKMSLKKEGKIGEKILKLLNFRYEYGF